jgi:hypothetical protein
MLVVWLQNTGYVTTRTGCYVIQVSDQLGGQMSGSAVSCITDRHTRMLRIFCAAGYRTSLGVLQRCRPVTMLRLVCDLNRLPNSDIIIRRAFQI